MAVDRGGLQYTIAIKDDFSASTAQFVSGIQAAKEAFTSFRDEVSKGRGAASSVRELAKATEASARAATKATSEQEAALKRLAVESKKQAALERESGRIRSAQSRDARRSTADQLREEQRRLRAIEIGERAREQTARRVLASLRKDEAAFQRDQVKRIQDVAAQRAEAERERLQLTRAARAEQAALDKLSPNVQGKRKADDLIQRRATAQAELAELRRLGREDLVTKQLRRQAGELKESSRSANNLLFTFRRLVGVLAVFQIARAVVGGFRDLVTQGVLFNDEIRQAEISIAGLITGLADVRDEQGRSVDLGNEYSRALGEARRQTELLRQDALLTTATFGQLLDTFQIAIGPGFAAGLNLDEIRRLSVSISQAAQAIGLPQNQLAEEIRSLLAGTIQARTTRIATALQITNADIRRLKQTGELFDFLEKKFKALGLAAEQAARQTLSGIGNLVKDATAAILGRAAQPLFDELIRLGNEVFDQVLTIRTATGDIKPNPEAVQAFRALFDALKDGVVQAKALARELGFEGLRNIAGTIGTGINIALQGAIGFLTTIGRAFNAIADAVRAIGSVLGLDVNGGLSNTSRLVGKLAADFLVLKTVGRLFGLDITRAFNPAKVKELGTAIKAFIATPLGKGGLVGIALAGVAKGFQTILEKIFNVNLGLRETVALLSIGLESQISRVVTQFDIATVKIAGFLKQAFSGEEADREIQARVKALTDALAAGEAEAQNALDKRISDIVNAARVAQGQLQAPADRPATDAKAGLAAFGSTVSNVESIVSKANTAIGELDNEMRQLGADLDATSIRTGKEGFAGQVEDAFADAASAAAQKTVEIRANLEELRAQIAKGVGQLKITPERESAIRGVAGQPAGKAQDQALAALKLSREEGQLISFLRDEARVRETIGEVEQQSLENARLKVAIQAREATPALRRELDTLREQATAEGAIAIAVTQRLGARKREAIEAQNAAEAFRVSSQRELQKIRDDLATARAASQPITFESSTADERARERERSQAALELAAALEKTLGLETAIAAAKQKQLDFTQRQAKLAAEGSFSAGIRAGLEQLANDLPTLFDAAKNIVQGITQSFIAATTKIFDAIVDPRVLQQADQTFSEFAQNVLGELLLSIGQLIFEQVVSTLIQSLLSSILTTTTVETAAATTAAGIKVTAATTAAAIEIEAATAAAAIRAASGGAASGGLVGAFASGGMVPAPFARARGLARGGRPPGLDPRDTVPAWLQPGEFVIRKAVVDSLGADFFSAVNAGSIVGPPPPAPAASPGMARGGMIVKREPAVSQRDGRERTVVVPALVTSEREMDRLQAGGKSSLLRTMRENAGTIRGILGLS